MYAKRCANRSDCRRWLIQRCACVVRCLMFVTINHWKPIANHFVRDPRIFAHTFQWWVAHIYLFDSELTWFLVYLACSWMGLQNDPTHIWCIEMVDVLVYVFASWSGGEPTNTFSFRSKHYTSRILLFNIVPQRRAVGPRYNTRWNNQIQTGQQTISFQPNWISRFGNIPFNIDVD